MTAAFYPEMIAHTLASDEPAAAKEHSLRTLMRSYGKVLVAYSGGVDSAYLGLIANQELGRDAVCVLGVSPSVSKFQKNEARSIADEFGFNFREIESHEMENPDYRANPTNRCYFCKSELYDKLRNFAARLEIEHIVDGTNADDVGDHRPGRTAAVEREVSSPLVDVGLTKNEIRSLSKLHGMRGWDKPSSPCLSSRIAYGVPVTIERLSQVERAEEFLRTKGFREFRVRVHGDLARVEIAKDEMPRVLDTEMMNEVGNELRAFGFRYVTLDLEGFRSGAMNEKNKILAIIDL